MTVKKPEKTAEAIEVSGKLIELTKLLPPKKDDVNVLANLHSKRTATWLHTPQQRLLRCITAALYKERGLRGRALFEGFTRLVPDYQRHFDSEISEKAISAKGYNAWFYSSESPERTDPVNWKLAQAIVQRAGPIDLDEVIASLAKETDTGQA